MTYQKMLSKIRQAVDDYHMIEEGDCIAVGISGGKDSLSLLYALHGLQRFYPKHFTLKAITIDLGFEHFNLDKISALCRELGVAYTIVHTQIAQIVFEERKEKNPCSLCAKLRKGALNNCIKELGCNKVAYAHHRDDVVETFMMSLIYEGRIHTFSPVTDLERVGLSVIRPMIYLDEAEIIGFVHKYDVPVTPSPCPADGNTKRAYIKQYIRQLNLDNPGVKKRMFTAIQNSELKDWKEYYGSH